MSAATPSGPGVRVETKDRCGNTYHADGTISPAPVAVESGTIRMTSGRQVAESDGFPWGIAPRLDAALEAYEHQQRIGSLDADHQKARGRYERHSQAALKAVAGMRSLLGSALAEPMFEHVRALTSDVDKHSSVAAGAIKALSRCAEQLGQARIEKKALQASIDDAGRILASAETVPRDPGVKIPLTGLAAQIAGHVAYITFRDRSLDSAVRLLLNRPTQTEHAAVGERVRYLEGRIEQLVADGKLARSTGRSWLRQSEHTEADYLELRHNSYEVRWATEWSGAPRSGDLLGELARHEDRWGANAAEAAAAGGHSDPYRFERPVTGTPVVD
jgi:hypothetical protein